MNSLSIVIPLFNRDLNVVRYVVNDMLANGADEVVLSNTGAKKTDIVHPRVLEVWQPLPIFYPGITRNMGAVVANGEVQVHAGADIILASGSWDVFQALDDRTTGSAPCALLNASQTREALKGKRNLTARFNKRCTAAFGITKRAAMEQLKGPFDWEMQKWGWVDVDVIKHARMLKMQHRILSANTYHLYHNGGCCTFSKSVHTPECKHNSQLMAAKKQGRGWWSGLPAKDSKRGDRTMVVDMKPAIKPMSTDEHQICGEFDFHTVDAAVALLKSALKALRPGKWVRVTFNDMEKLGAGWARGRANQKNSAGRIRVTFWTMVMMQKAITDAGFMNVQASEQHIGRSPFGVSTVIGQKPEEKIVAEESKPLKVEAKPEPESTKQPEYPPVKRRRGRPRKNA